jgi:hypothetical protein
VLQASVVANRAPAATRDPSPIGVHTALYVVIINLKAVVTGNKEGFVPGGPLYLDKLNIRVEIIVAQGGVA